MNVSFRPHDLSSSVQVIKGEYAKVRKAALNALKVEAYRQVRELTQEIREGAPGGQQFEPLTVIKTMGIKRLARPLIGLAHVPKYSVVGTGSQEKVIFGFLKVKSSRKYIDLATRLQDGFTRPADDVTPVGSTYRKLFAREGAALKKAAGERKTKKSQDKTNAIAKYFFLRKSTASLVTPARPIIVPFWQKHQAEAAQNIVSNFERKLRGEKI